MTGARNTGTPGTGGKGAGAVSRRRFTLKRVAIWGATAILALVLLLGAAVAFVLATPPGSRWALNRGLALSPIPVTIAETRGTLVGPLTLSGIEVDFRGVRTRVERVTVDWRALGILRRTVRIDSLFVTGVDIAVPLELDPASPAEAPAEPREGPPVVPDLPVEVVVDTFRVEVAGLTTETGVALEPSVLGGSGSLDGLHVEARVRGRASGVDRFEASALMDGSPDDYELSSQLEVAAPDLPPALAELSAAGSMADLRVERMTVRTADGEAGLVADVAWYPELSWGVEAEARGIQVAPFTPTPEDWPGAVSFQLSSEGRLPDSGLDAEVTISELSGDLRGQPLGGGVDVRAVEGAVEVRELDLNWGGIRAMALGRIEEELDLEFSVEVPDLGLALPGGEGMLAAEGSVSGSRSEPRIAASFDAEGLVLDSLGLGEAAGSVDLDLAPGATNRLDVRALALFSGELLVDSVVVSGEGLREEHRLGVRGWMGDNRLAVGVTGGLTGLASDTSTEEGELQWVGTLDSLSVFAEPVGLWQLEEPARILAGADSASLSELCVGQEGARACAEGGWAAGGGAGGSARLVSLPMALAGPFLPETVGLEGEVNGEAVFALQPDGALSAEGGFSATGTIQAAAGAEPVTFDLAGEGISFDVGEDGATARLDVGLTPRTGSGDIRASGEVRLPELSSIPVVPEDQPLAGRVEAVSDDLSFLAAFSHLIAGAGGRLRLDSEIGGTMARPSLLGTLDLADGSADIPALGLELREGTVRAQGDPSGEIALEAEVRSGDGTVRVVGSTPAVPDAEDPARLEISGERFRAIDTSEIQVEISPDLQIAFDGELTTVRGRLAVPWTRIELVEVPEAAVRPSPDVVLVDEEETPLPLVDARLEIVVGDDVFFSGFGFTSSIEGDIEVIQAPEEEPLLRGELRFIDGRFAAYGQNLDIDPGRVIFAGSPLDAALDVTAERLAQDGTRAGLIISGPALQPDITLTSDPAMADADVLAYIMYGRSLSEGDASQQEQVVGAAATLGANVLTTRLAGSVGLDEARIEGGTKETAELVAGKYLTPSVFVSYGRGLFKPSNTFRVKYLLSSQWALQAESGDANGGDVLYQIERGR